MALWEEAGHEIGQPFLRMTFEEALESYGTDKPDLRYGWPIVDIGDLVGGRGFQAFDDALDRPWRGDPMHPQLLCGGTQEAEQSNLEIGNDLRGGLKKNARLGKPPARLPGVDDVALEAEAPAELRLGAFSPQEADELAADAPRIEFGHGSFICQIAT